MAITNPGWKKQKVFGAKFTTTLQTLYDSGYFDTHDMLHDYPIWDEDYRPILNVKILNHYRFWEIGRETPESFRVWTNTIMHEIMPYYNKLAELALVEFDPLTEFNWYERRNAKGTLDAKITGHNENETTNDSNANNQALGADSDTPQNFLEQSIPNFDWPSYATSANMGKGTSASNSKGKGESDSTASNDTTTTDYYFKRTKGFKSYPADLILKAVDAIIEVDTQIINDIRLKRCFSLIWE